MKKQHVTVLVLLHLIVRHLIPWITMFYTVGFTKNLAYLGRRLNGFVPTVNERSQRATVEENLSRSLNWTLLFTVYASTLFDVIKAHPPTVHCYTDDTQLYESFSPNKAPAI